MCCAIAPLVAVPVHTHIHTQVVHKRALRAQLALLLDSLLSTESHQSFGLNTMEINSHYNHIQRKGDTISSVNYIQQESGGGGGGGLGGGGGGGGVSVGTIGRDIMANNISHSAAAAAAAAAAASSQAAALQEQHIQFQQQLIQLKQQQQLQQQLLLQHFQQQQQQLAEQHEKQLQERIRKKYEEEQRVEKERMEKEKLESLKKKEKHEQSAIASSEVKQRLQEFVLNKKHREATAAANSANNSPPTPGTRNWQPVIGKYENDFPLRKTASEPNLKVRSVLKAKVIQRRSSPLLRRKDKASPLKRRSTLTSNGIPECLSESPPSGSNHSSFQSSAGSTPIQEEPCHSPFSSMNPGSFCDLTLYSSPSLPNISLGRPHVPITTTTTSASVTSSLESSGKSTTTSMSETQMQRALRFAMPLNIHPGHHSTAGLPFYPSLPVIEGEFTPPTSPGYIQQQMKVLEQTTNRVPAQTITGGTTGNSSISGYPYPPPPPGSVVITDQQVAQARLQRSLQRPLGRTQSAPLPLGHPLLQQAGPGIILSPQQSEQYYRERQLDEQLQQRNLVKQHIRQTVLTRASSKGQVVENVEEETEAAVAQEMKDSLLADIQELPPAGPDGVIDLTAPASRQRAASSDSSSELSRQQHRQQQREAFLQQQRDLMSPSSSSSSHRLLSASLSSSSMFNSGGGGGGGGDPISTTTNNNLLLTTISQSSSSSHHHLHQRPGHQPHPNRPLSRTLSSPLVTLSLNTTTGQQQQHESMIVSSSSAGGRHVFTTGLVYDSLMLKHQCICADNFHHPEHGGRLQSIWARLQETGLASRCERVRSRKATLDEIQLCHSESYTLLFGTNPLNRQKLDASKLADLPIKSFVMLPCGGIGVDSDTTWNEMHTSGAARMAAGCVVELAFKVATGECKNGFAVVRPPGSHAEHQQAMGFCFFNSIAIAIKQLQLKLKMERILVVDWDVHHGNGLQQMFYNDPHVLYVSLHRHDDGNFFPGTGDLQETGIDDGVGFNVNIGWCGSLSPPMGDAEYLAAFRSVVMPIARDFNPDLIMVACGFDSAQGHPPPLGGYQITANCFGYLTQQLMTLAKGRVVMALEGGYDLPAICDCSQECVSALLGDDLSGLTEDEMTRKPCQNAVELLQRVVSIQSTHWPILRRTGHLIDCNFIDAQRKEKEECETVTALASLTVRQSLNSPPETSGHSEEPMDEDNDK
ncbi:histone deacetylase 4-like isoform X2 [Oppia nitens]|uniref:histone deacetylase 4-like isoform X2 n=1 Tax=Oppia nitens TaxID=1686743 RepID=UPI0023DAF70C|nr:histone deacetylase 4-like isoform X2 [Oppia nitens]